MIRCPWHAQLGGFLLTVFVTALITIGIKGAGPARPTGHGAASNQRSPRSAFRNSRGLGLNSASQGHVRNPLHLSPLSNAIALW